MGKRFDDNGRMFFASDRFYVIDNKFYFSTRESEEIGPFDNRTDALLALELYIENIQTGKASIAHAKKVAMEGAWATTNFQ